GRTPPNVSPAAPMVETTQAPPPTPTTTPASAAAHSRRRKPKRERCSGSGGVGAAVMVEVDSEAFFVGSASRCQVTQDTCPRMPQAGLSGRATLRRLGDHGTHALRNVVRVLPTPGQPPAS